MWIVLESSINRLGYSNTLTSILGKWAKIKKSFEKDIFKLMVNRTFGEATKNLRKRVDVRLATHKNLHMKLTNKTNTRIIKNLN